MFEREVKIEERNAIRSLDAHAPAVGRRLPTFACSFGGSRRASKKGIEGGKVKEGAVGPPSAERGASSSGERSCGQCKSPLAADWTHCPRCGTATAKP